jgi:prepilin-type processing-associated H-X9-DG protein
MVDAFSAYGITQKTIQCPSDVKSPGGGSYAAYGSSYDWRPTLDDENESEPLIYGGAGRFMRGAQVSGTNSTGAVAFNVKLSKIRQAYDDTQIHFGHANALYADGHVVSFSAPSGH